MSVNPDLTHRGTCPNPTRKNVLTLLLTLNNDSVTKLSVTQGRIQDPFKD